MTSPKLPFNSASIHGNDKASMATYEDNIQASYHVRHRKTGGVA